MKILQPLTEPQRKVLNYMEFCNCPSLYYNLNKKWFWKYDFREDPSLAEKYYRWNRSIVDRALKKLEESKVEKLKTLRQASESWSNGMDKESQIPIEESVEFK